MGIIEGFLKINLMILLQIVNRNRLRITHTDSMHRLSHPLEPPLKFRSTITQCLHPTLLTHKLIPYNNNTITTQSISIYINCKSETNRLCSYIHSLKEKPTAKSTHAIITPYGPPTTPLTKTTPLTLSLTTAPPPKGQVSPFPTALCSHIPNTCTPQNTPPLR